MSVYEGVHRLMNPQPLQNVMVNYIVKDDILPDTVEKTVQTSVGEIKKPGRWSNAFLSKVKPAAVRILQLLARNKDKIAVIVPGKSDIRIDWCLVGVQDHASSDGFEKRIHIDNHSIF